MFIFQLLSHIQLFATPWTATHQASLFFIISQSLLKFMFIESEVLSNQLILCHPFLLLPSIFPRIRVFSNELAPHIWQPKLGRSPGEREWLPTPVFLPGEFHGQRSLVGYSPWGCKESETTERLTLFGTAVINLNPCLLPIYSLGLRVKPLFLFTKFKLKTKPHKLGHVKMKDTMKRNRVNSLGRN